MPYRRKKPPLEPCPVETVVAMFSGRWKVRVLYLLSRQDLAFNEIKAATGAVSQQVLSNLLRELEADALVARTGTATLRVSCYRLTPKGHTLVRLLAPVAAWGTELLSEQGLIWNPPPPVQGAVEKGGGGRFA
jgi:DNA-binding HxlR family transcriptional regulator